MPPLRWHCPLDSAKALSESKLPGDFTFSVSQQGLEIESKGVAVHAMQPDKGFNAISHAVALLGSVLPEEDLGAFLTFLLQKWAVKPTELLWVSTVPMNPPAA